MARFSVRNVLLISILVVAVVVSTLFLFPYYTATQLSAEYFTRSLDIYAMKISIALKIQNRGLLDLTIRNVQVKLYCVRISDNHTYVLFGSGLPSTMIGEEGFILHMNSYRNYTITFSGMDMPTLVNIYRYGFNAIISNMKVTLGGEVSCLWYTKRFTIDLPVAS